MKWLLCFYSIIPVIINNIRRYNQGLQQQSRLSFYSLISKTVSLYPSSNPSDAHFELGIFCSVLMSTHSSHGPAAASLHAPQWLVDHLLTVISGREPLCVWTNSMEMTGCSGERGEGGGKGREGIFMQVHTHAHMQAQTHTCKHKHSQQSTVIPLTLRYASISSALKRSGATERLVQTLRQRQQY